MILYHGSESIIEKPLFGKGKKTNDYGQGFYLTKEFDKACEWAVDENSNGYVNEYILEEKGLKILYLNSKKYNVLHWISLLVQNRVLSLNSPTIAQGIEYLKENYSIDVRDYDVIIGYRADDSYFTFARDFLSNSISTKLLRRAIKLGKLGEQVVLVSKKAFDNIKLVKYHEISKDEYYPKKKARDYLARREYNILKQEYVLTKEDVFINELITGKVDKNDSRI